MRTGLIYPNFGDGLSITSSTAWDANYPVTNLGDILFPSRVARTAGTGFGSIGFSFTAQQVQGLALVAHTFRPGDILRVKFARGGSVVADTGDMQVWPSGAAAGRLKPTRPVILNTAVTADSGTIDFQAAAGVEIGALDVGQFWRWKGISFGRDFGFDPRNVVGTLAGGATEASPAPLPRVLRGQIDFIALGAPTNTVLDFQRDMDTQRPFVMVGDADDSSTWARMAFQATNAELPALQGAAYRHDRFQFNLVENQR